MLLDNITWYNIWNLLFLEWQVDFKWNFTEICSSGSILKYVITVSDNAYYISKCDSTSTQFTQTWKWQNLIYFKKPAVKYKVLPLSNDKICLNISLMSYQNRMQCKITKHGVFLSNIVCCKHDMKKQSLRKLAMSCLFQFVVTDYSQTKSVRTDVCHRGLFPEFVGTACCI